MAAQLQSFSRKKGKYQPMAEINVTPFVDVMLVLLIIFMVTSPMLVAGVNVDLPETGAAPVTAQDEPLYIQVDVNGQVSIRDQRIAFDHFIPKLQSITEAKKDTRIFVYGDKRVDYGKVMRVMGAINEAGYSKVALITDIAQGDN